MPTLLEEVARLAKERKERDEEFRAALVAAREFHSWGEIANFAGMSRGGVIHLVEKAARVVAGDD